MTDRIGISKSSPSTAFYLEADRIGQNLAGNFTTVRLYLRAVNTGSSGSFSNAAGQQIGSIDGIGIFGSHNGAPFLPSGVPAGLRWRDGPWDVNIPHAADGTRAAVTLRQGLYYDGGAVAQDDTATFNDFPAIPRGPKVEQAGTWKQSVTYVEQAGTWKTALVYVEKAGAWVIST